MAGRLLGGMAPRLTSCGRRLLLAALAAVSVGGVTLAVLAQRSFTPPHLSIRTLTLFALGIGLAAASLAPVYAFGVQRVQRFAEPRSREAKALTGARAAVVRACGAAAGLGVAYMAFRASGADRFTGPGLAYWLLGMAVFVATQWEVGSRPRLKHLRGLWRVRRVPLVSALLVGGVAVATGVAAFFRFYRLDSLPPQLTGDLLINVLDTDAIRHGQSLIYYAHSDGAAFVYTAAALGTVFGLPSDFLTIKMAGALAGVLAVPATYLLVKEALGSRPAGLLAAFLMASAHWPVLLGRGGLRLSFTTFFVALVCWLMIRALKYGRRNDFLLCGLALGLSLYNYTAIRVLPVLVVGCLALAFGASLLSRWREGRPVNLELLPNSLLLLGAALTAVAPLARYAIDFPDDYWRPWLTLGPNAAHVSLGATFHAIAGNVKEAALMFGWLGDIVWANNIPFSPALDDITAVLFPLGMLIVALSWLRRPSLIPVCFFAGLIALMGPTILATANSGDNPAFGRAAGAIPFVLGFAGLPIYLGAVSLRRALGLRLGSCVAIGGVVTLLAFVGVMNYRWYFNDYQPVARANTLDYSGMAGVIRDFEDAGGSLTNAYLVSWPYWADYRAVAVELGDLGWKNGLGSIKDAAAQVAEPGDKLYLLNRDDGDSVAWLQETYPNGRLQLYLSKQGESHDFLVFYATGTPGQSPPP
jgi:hypothetical protein